MLVPGRSKRGALQCIRIPASQAAKRDIVGEGSVFRVVDKGRRILPIHRMSYLMEIQAG